MDFFEPPPQDDQPKLPPPEIPSGKPPGPPPKCPFEVPLAALSKSDKLIRRVDQFISSAYGTERLFASVQYNAQIIHYLLASRRFRSLSARLRSLLPPLVSKSTSKPTPPSPATKAATPPLLALSSLMSETRTTLRLLGLFSLWSWGSATVKNPPTDPILRAIAYSQVLANVLYQFLENVAHLAGKGILSKRLVERWGSLGAWWVWSTRAWLAHVLLEFVRVGREIVLLRQKQRAERGGKLVPKEEEIAREVAVRGWKKSLVNSLAWLPLCVHWSFEEGVGVPDHLVGLLSMTASAWGVRDLWKGTPEV
ncbi:hypothetical protein AJ79_03413 [Helicocarpus griseus UAMH5409]|uniref:Peroxin 11C n=1 Tax=Helicocarpus griseus UAMH5409 TaxID=1447875 RepID=A0A2B7XY26_9EURO|nr:hypothetical protein AJ79_03413 [Helicocarpus griseus UAMH5409]